MSSPNLPAGAFVTTLNGRRCTAIPRSSSSQVAASTPTANNNSNNNNNNNNDDENARPQQTASADSGSFAGVLSSNEAETSTAKSTSPPESPEPETTILPPPPPPPQLQITSPLETEQDVASLRTTPPASQPPSLTQAPSPAVVLPGSAVGAIVLDPSPSEIPSPQPQNTGESTAESSQTDNDTAPAIDTPTQPTVVGPPAPIGEPDVINNNANDGLLSTIAPNQIFPTNEAAATSNPSVDVASQNSGDPAPAPSVAILAGSVAGGVVGVSLIAFFLWFWRKRVIKKRRSTLLTPLSVAPAFGNGGGNGGNGGTNEKSYVIDRDSLGPTPKSEKIRAAVGANVAKFRNQFGRNREDKANVNMNRGNSQFFDPSAPEQHSRSTSVLTGNTGPRDVVTTKDRFKDWFSRLTEDINFNWRIKNDSKTAAGPFATTLGPKGKKATGSQPDFLTLLGMDEREVQREAEKRQLTGHSNKGSDGSSNHFLGGLGLNFDAANDPFSDSNALPHNSAKPAPLAVSQPANPFSDENAVGVGRSTGKASNTYVADVRRSRGLGDRPPSRSDSLYRESVQSVETGGARRTKFRSDPFDLERPELLLNRQNVTSSNLSTLGESVATGISGLPSRPGRTRARGESFSSKYSSGGSLGDWSDPGPDVGPAAGRWDSPTEGWRLSDNSDSDRRPRHANTGAGQGSVGKAL